LGQAYFFCSNRPLHLYVVCSGAKPGWTIGITDDVEVLLMIGNDTNSCQQALGIPGLNRCLLSYVLDGKSKVAMLSEPTAHGAPITVVRCVVLLLLIDRRGTCTGTETYIGTGTYTDTGTGSNSGATATTSRRVKRNRREEMHDARKAREDAQETARDRWQERRHRRRGDAGIDANATSLWKERLVARREQRRQRKTDRRRETRWTQAPETFLVVFAAYDNSKLRLPGTKQDLQRIRTQLDVFASEEARRLGVRCISTIPIDR
jgi:hypothetical protein